MGLLASDYVIEHDCLAELCIAIVQRAKDDIALTMRRPDDGIYTVEDLRFYQQDARRFLAEVREHSMAFSDSVAAVLCAVVERRAEAGNTVAANDDEEPTKYCFRCKQDRPYSDFRWIRRVAGGKEYWGFDSYCHECQRARCNEKRHEWNEKRRERKAMARKAAHA